MCPRMLPVLVQALRRWRRGLSVQQAVIPAGMQQLRGAPCLRQRGPALAQRWQGFVGPAVPCHMRPSRVTGALLPSCIRAPSPVQESC